MWSSSAYIAPEMLCMETLYNKFTTKHTRNTPQGFTEFCQEKCGNIEMSLAWQKQELSILAILSIYEQYIWNEFGLTETRTLNTVNIWTVNLKWIWFDRNNNCQYCQYMNSKFFFPARFMKVYGGRSLVPPLILNPSTRWRWYPPFHATETTCTSRRTERKSLGSSGRGNSVCSRRRSAHRSVLASQWLLQHCVSVLQFMSACKLRCAGGRLA